jgi:hypothetical protein
LEVAEVKDWLKKETETDHLRRFKEALVDFPEGPIVATERPDFVVETEQANVGIEVTNLYRNGGTSGGSRLRATESLQDDTLRQAAQLYEAKETLPHVQVSVFWSFHTPVTKARTQHIAGTLAELVAAYLPDPGEQAFLGYPDPTWKLLPQEVDHIFVSRSASLPENAWGSSRGAAVPKLQPQDISEAISAKERKLSSYRQQCSEAWLLIVADGLAPSNHFEWTKEVGDTCFETAFDRVFFLHYSHGFVAELMTSPVTPTT